MTPYRLPIGVELYSRAMVALGRLVWALADSPVIPRPPHPGACGCLSCCIAPAHLRLPDWVDDEEAEAA